MIKLKIINYLKKIIKEDIEIEVFVPEKEEFGHYSTNVVLKLAKILKKNPMEAAEEIKIAILQVAAKDFFEKIEVAAPGFINFRLSEKVLQNELKEILKKKENYGKFVTKYEKNTKIRKYDKKLKIQVEFVSANPTGPLTLANGRGGFMGDALSNVLEFSGYDVEREYYVNDTGNQVFILGKSILDAIGLYQEAPTSERSRGPDYSVGKNFYKGEYVKEWARKNSSKVKKFKSNPLKIGQLAAKDFFAEIKKNEENF